MKLLFKTRRDFFWRSRKIKSLDVDKLKSILNQIWDAFPFHKNFFTYQTCGKKHPKGFKICFKDTKRKEVLLEFSGNDTKEINGKAIEEFVI